MPIDYNKYPPNWKNEIVPKVLERAKNRCEKCGVKNKKIIYSVPIMIKTPGDRRYGIRRVWFENFGEVIRIEKITAGKIKQVKVVLTVAHLDHDEENHDVKLDRLQAWCQYCHLVYDAKEKFRRINSKGEK